jgi:hypothetical protein
MFMSTANKPHTASASSVTDMLRKDQPNLQHQSRQGLQEKTRRIDGPCVKRGSRGMTLLQASKNVWLSD